MGHPDSTSATRPQTSATAAVVGGMRNPRLLLPLLRSSFSHRVAGPALSRWRAGGVAMIHTGRCGSTVLSDLLDQHPDMYWDGETYGRVVAGLKRDGLDRAQVSFDPAQYVAHRMKRSGRRWFGYDLKFSHVTEFGHDVEGYLQAIADLGVDHLISLRRRNYLRQVISGKNGGRRGQFHSRTAVVDEFPPLHLDTDDLDVDLYRGSLLEHFERWDDLYRRLDELDLPRYLSLNYEDHVQRDPTVGYGRAEEFLGLRPHLPEVRLVRLAPDRPVRELLDNFDAVCRHLAGSRYEWMLES
jgi:hypothetical protein